MTSTQLVTLARVPGPVVTGILATIGAFALGFGVMTDCTNSYSCSTSGCDPCSTTSAVLVAGWVLQGVLFVVALALCLPPVAGRLRQTTLVCVALAVPLVSVLAFGGVAVAADRSYCRPGQGAAGGEDYCDVR